MADDMMMAARIAELEGLVRECGEQFRFYEASHRAKIAPGGVNEDAQSKAEVNRSFADRCAAALAPARYSAWEYSGGVPRRLEIAAQPPSPSRREIMSITELASRVELYEMAGPRCPVASVDREQMAIALALQGFEVNRAHSMCFDITDRAYLRNNDGALQMLARHRIAAEASSAEGSR